jgi:hypothetical protein
MPISEMAGNTDLNYFNYSADLDSPPPGGCIPEGQVLCGILWIIDRLVIHHGVVSFPFLELHQSILEPLKTAAPGIPLKKDLTGLRYLLKTVSRPLVMKNNIKIINTTMSNRFGSLRRISSIFSFAYQAEMSEARFATPYYNFLQFIKLMIMYAEYQIWKCNIAVRLVMTHESYQTVVDYLQTTLDQLDDGAISLDTAKSILELAGTSRNVLEYTFGEYWRSPIVPHSWTGWQVSIFRRLFPRLNTHSKLSIADIKISEINGTLHNYNVQQEGQDFCDWEEVATLNLLVENSRQRIGSYFEHPIFSLERLAESVRIDMDHIKTKVVNIMMAPQTAEIGNLTSLVADMRTATSKLTAALMMGLPFTEENFGVDWTLFFYLCKIVEDKIQQSSSCPTNNPDTEE